MEVLNILVIVVVKLCIDAGKRRDAANFSKWMRANGPDRFMSSSEMKSWERRYDLSKKR